MSISWTAHSGPLGYVTDVVWADLLGLFIAGGNEASGPPVTIATSPDGSTWTQRANTFDGGSVSGLGWDGVGMAIACGNDAGSTKSLMSSTDGITWTYRASSFDGGYAADAAWSPALSLWVAVGTDSLNTVSVCTSPDGITWTARTSPMDGGYGNGVVWAPALGLFIATGTNGATFKIVTSPDGIVWTAQATPLGVGDTGARVAWNNSLPMAVVVAYGASPNILYSPDAVTWTGTTSDLTTVASGVTDTATGFVAFGLGAAHATAESADGITWSSGSSPFDPGPAYSGAYSSSLDLIAGGGAPPTSIATGTFSAPPVASHFSPLWRWFVTDLAGVGITLLDHLAADRVVTPKLNEPLEVTCTLPSDSPEVNRIATTPTSSNFPQVAEGVRLLYCFRREYDGDAAAYKWRIRASTLILQTTDSAMGDDARTRVTAFDPWQQWFYRPVMRQLSESVDLLPREGHTYKAGSDSLTSYDQLILLWLSLAAEIAGGGLSAVNNMWVDWGQTAYYTGTIETCADIENWHVDPTTSLGQAILDICSAGYCDIWLEPIYDPINRPGYLCQLSILKQTTDTVGGFTGGLGAYQFGQSFSWDMPMNTAMGADNLFDGTQRANVVQFAMAGGRWVTRYSDTVSEGVYGQYWALQTYPGQVASPKPVEVTARMQLALRKDYKETLTMRPAPERAPDPFTGYNIGDRVPVYISQNMRQPLPFAGDTDLIWQRIYGIPIAIDDNGTETVSELLVGPVGPPPA